MVTDGSTFSSRIPLYAKVGILLSNSYIYSPFPSPLLGRNITLYTPIVIKPELAKRIQHIEGEKRPYRTKVRLK